MQIICTILMKLFIFLSLETLISGNNSFFNFDHYNLTGEWELILSYQEVLQDKFIFIRWTTLLLLYYLTYLNQSGYFRLRNDQITEF